MNETIINEINTLRKAKNAVILAHNYQPDEIQEIADYTGDSLGLSRQAAETKAEVIVFCGVFFMAETAKILSPEKKVLLPDFHAGCPMADMITGEKLRAFKAAHPGRVTVCYVNSTAEVKAESDICCTSANAIKVVNSIPKDKGILFVPDKHLGRFTKEKTGRDIICWEGFCPTHMKITPEALLACKERYPKAIVMVHPECRWDVIELADEALSTGQMIEKVRSSSHPEFIIGTEKGILFQLRKENPDKVFHLVSPDIVCPNMKKITIEKVARVLRDGSGEVTVPSDMAQKARASIERMLAL